MRFIKQKSYPTGYEAPSCSGYYTGIPILEMLPFIPQSEVVTYPDIFLIRARIGVEKAPYWPFIEGLGFGLERDDLYSLEGLRIRQQGRILSISLIHTGFCGLPSPEGLLPWTHHPFNAGDVFWRHDFLRPLEKIPPPSESPLMLFPLGGYLQNPTKILASTPLYFFLERGEISPSVRFLFWSDIKDIQGTENVSSPLGSLTFAQGLALDPYATPDAALLQRDFRLILGGITYDSVQVNVLSGDGTLVDVVMMRAPLSPLG